MWKTKVFRAGKIVEIGEKKIKVELFSKTLPTQCQAKGCTACQTHSAQIVRAYPKNNFVNEVSVDDIVKIEAWQINDGFAATALFMTPILFAAVFYHIAVVCGISQESIFSILTALLGGIFGFGIAVFFDESFRKLNPAIIIKE